MRGRASRWRSAEHGSRLKAAETMRAARLSDRPQTAIAPELD